MPAVALACVAVVLTAMGVVGLNPFWPRPRVTMAEAAALRDAGTVAWLLESGVDPNVPMRVRPGILSNGQLLITPADAAIRADRTEVLQTLLLGGLRTDDAEVHDWWCLAREVGSEESEAWLEARFPDWTRGSCGAPDR